jgi:hypothetical protein
VPDPRINLKNPVLASLLAFLLPGAGHLYQGRMFKSVVYAVCIWGTYLTGNAMSHWRAVQAPKMSEVRTKIGLSLKFGAQLGVGLPGLYAMYQNVRVAKPGNQVTRLKSPLDASYTGSVRVYDAVGHSAVAKAEGQVHLDPPDTGTFKGTYQIKDEEPREVEWELSNVALGRKIAPGLERDLLATVRDGSDRVADLNGSIPRSFFDGFGAPGTDADEEDAHRRLGKFHELAAVLTWIAGLLNVLAIWDAFEGPAYGYGDEKEKAKPDEPKKEPPPTPPA